MFTRFLPCLCLFLQSTALFAQYGTGSPEHCGYKIELTAVGKQIQGALVPVDNPGALIQVEWRILKGNQLLSESPSFNYTVSDFGNYNVQASFSAYSADGQSVCGCEMRQVLQIMETGCSLAPVICATAPTTVSACPAVFSPVCGCDGITYANACAAERAGAATWWAGECAMQTTCGTTDISYKVIGGGVQTGYDVLFVKQCTGNFTNIQLDFGDGSPFETSTLWDSLVHHYASGGVYSATLSAWKMGYASCVSSVSEAVITDAASYAMHHDIFATDYVQPGDANGDGKSNVHDMIPLGLGYGSTGVPRPEASNDWVSQYSPNWPAHTSEGVNYKHLDCNGDGVVNEFDMIPLEANYTSAPFVPMPVVPGVPCLHTNFSEDTIYINPNIPGGTEVEISADVHIGSPFSPVFNLYGISMSLEYPEFFGHTPELIYKPEFLGSPNYVLTMSKDQHDALQLDLGFVHKHGNGSSGYGNLARLNFRADFIIIIDIIDRADNKTIALSLPIGSVRTVDAEGNSIPLSAPPTPDTVWVKFSEPLSSDTEAVLNRQIRMFPNPASEQVSIQSTADAAIERIEVVNTLGQVVHTVEPTQGEAQTIIGVKDFAKGLYTVRISTTLGATERKLVVQ